MGTSVVKNSHLEDFLFERIFSEKLKFWGDKIRERRNKETTQRGNNWNDTIQKPGILVYTVIYILLHSFIRI